MWRKKPGWSNPLISRASAKPQHYQLDIWWMVWHLYYKTIQLLQSIFPEKVKSSIFNLISYHHLIIRTCLISPAPNHMEIIDKLCSKFLWTKCQQLPQFCKCELALYVSDWILTLNRFSQVAVFFPLLCSFFLLLNVLKPRRLFCRLSQSWFNGESLKDLV